LDKSFAFTEPAVTPARGAPRWFERPGLWYAAFAALILINRLAALHDEIVNWDEDTFMVMAQDVLRGHLPYVAMFDNKPPGIFLWTAAVFKTFGASVAAVRLTSGLWMAATAVFAFLIARRFASIAAAGIAVLLTLTASFDPITGGFSSTEWPCVAFLIAAFWLQLAHGQSLGAAFAAGLCAAAAILFRTNAAVAAAMIGLVYAAGFFVPRLALQRFSALAYALGLALPPAAIALLYGARGQFDVLWLANVAVPFSYARGQNGLLIATKQFLDVFGEMVLRWPYTLGAVAVLTTIGLWRARRADPQVWTLAVVSAAALLAILVCGTFYPHYMVQALPFAAVWTAIAIERRPPLAGLCAAVIVVLFAGQAATALAPPAPYDVRHAARALQPILKPSDTIWALRYHLIEVYLDRPPVSPAALHPSNITRPSIIRPLMDSGYVRPNELGRVIASRPAYLVTAASRPVPLYLNDAGGCFARFMAADYALWRDFGEVRIYRRKPNAAVLSCPAVLTADSAE
jgi:hypothetical protein